MAVADYLTSQNIHNRVIIGLGANTDGIWGPPLDTLKNCLKELKENGTVILGLRPEDVSLDGESGDSDIPAEIYVTEPLGNETIVDVSLGENVIKVITDPDYEGKSGQKIKIGIDCAKLHFFDAGTHRCIYHASEKDGIRVLLN